MDLHALEPAYLLKDVPTAVRTGIAIELTPGTEGQVRPRSGLALKHGVTVWNAPGTVDPSYRGEIKVILLWNGLGDFEFFDIKPGDRIAQLVIARYLEVVMVESEELSESLRGVGGFGSSGIGSDKPIVVVDMTLDEPGSRPSNA